MKVLGIETSCDETSMAIVEDGTDVISNLTTSSLNLHKKYGGIVPEIANRHHVEALLPLLSESLTKSNLSLQDIDLIAVTQGPGLIGSLIVGITFAKSLAYAIRKPILGLDHLLSHLYAPYLNGEKPGFPYLGLVVSGGHTSLFILKNFLEFELIGKTRDDAIGEAFDKVAKLLKLGFPGGPLIEKRADQAKKKNISFPTPAIKDSLDFSYSGLKTAVLYYLRKQKNFSPSIINEVCFGFQESAFKAIIEQINNARRRYKIRSLVAGGGVIANKRLRYLLKELDLEVHLPLINYSTDNAGMVAGLAYQLYNKGLRMNINFEPYSIFEQKWMGK